ncbi:MAG: hypothetical protein KatS3mg112_1396 [Thermogutta sp.]|nr:MAG: hypothetical protein KatS3mg112_1396 [Thermogutta sp.]
MKGQRRFVDERTRSVLAKICIWSIAATSWILWTRRFRPIGVICTAILTIACLVLMCNSWDLLRKVVCVIGWIIALIWFIAFILDELGLIGPPW